MSLDPNAVSDARGASLSVRLAEMLGAPVDPDIRLAEKAFADVEFGAELLARLSNRVPVSTRYQLLGEVAQGGMGAVLRVWDEDLRRNLAMKVIREGSDSEGELALAARRRLVARFLEEAQVTGQLDHPGIVPVHELGLDPEGRLYFTMKLVKGKTLKDVFEELAAGTGGWTRERVLGLLLKVCEAMSYAHDKGVIHRDLKPSNVMVGRYGEVYVMDWGLAKILGREDARDLRIRDPKSFTGTRVHSERSDTPDSPLFTMDGDVVGTPAYMPPEQAAGRLADLGPRSDVYAVGAMLYHLLAGHMPYVPPGVRASNYAVWRWVQEGPPRPLRDIAPDVPPELVAICEHAMQRDPAERYGDMSAFAADLTAYVEGRVVQAYDSGRWARASKWVRRNPWLAGSAAAGLVLLVLVAWVASIARIEARGRDAANELLDAVFALAGIHSLAELEERAGRLYPTVPETVPAYERWLEDARGLVDGLPADSARGVRARPGLRALKARLAQLNAELAVDPESTSSFHRSIDTLWWRDQLSHLVSGLESLADHVHGLAEGTEITPQGLSIPWRMEFARGVEDLTLFGPAARDRWAAASAAIAGSPHYGGLRLEPQLGLLPLRADPGSGLWEFWHTLSGEEPMLDPATDRWRIEEATGVVLVLIPGDTYLLGTRDVPDGHLHSDEYRHNDKSDALNHTVSLEPYFISKYELTQAQWRRVRGVNPSRHRDGPETHPVDLVSWHDSMDALRRLDLTLPTEAQWEAAARARADTRFYTGAWHYTLVGHAVLFPNAEGAYQLDRDDQGKPVEVYGRPWRDHSEPVGSCLPNPFGLHDVHGNVFEWCLDGFDRAAPPRPGDGLRRAPEASPQRVLRGGAYSSPWPNARLTYRFPWEPQNAEGDVGLRPARGVR